MTNSIYSPTVGRKPKPPPNERAAWVRHVREEVAHLSQDVFAAEIGVERPTVSNWERGRYVPEWDSIEKILKRFPQAPRPAFGSDGAMSDPDRRLRAEANAGEYVVKTDQGRIIAKMIDAIEDEGARTRIMKACLDVLDHPAGRGKQAAPRPAQVELWPSTNPKIIRPNFRRSRRSSSRTANACPTVVD